MIKGKKKRKTNNVWSVDKTLVETEESAGAVIRKCSVNNVFWKIWQMQDSNMRDASTIKLNLAAIIFHVHSFVSLFS